jgi:hypothetical protein
MVALWTGLIGPQPPGGQTAVDVPPGGQETRVAPRLAHGTVQEGERATGYGAPSVGYLPDGAVLEGAWWQAPSEGAEIWLGISYAVGNQSLAVRKHPAEGRWSRVTPEQASKEVSVRGLPTEYFHVSPDPGDSISTGWTLIRWVDEEWCYVVEGNLDPDELLKIAGAVGL